MPRTSGLRALFRDLPLPLRREQARNADEQRRQLALDRYAEQQLEAGAAPDPWLRAAAGADLRRAAERAEREAARQQTAAPLSNGREAMERREEQLRRRVQQRVDEAIAEATARGDFANLPGKGKPIPVEQLAPAGDAWMANKALANSGFLPPWLQLRKEIDADLEQCRHLVERVERFPPLVNRDQPLDDLRRRLETIRAKGRRYNLLVPSLRLQRPLPKTGELLDRMERALRTPPASD